MKFEGEHLLPGQIGHFLILLAFVCSLLSTIFYITASYKKDITERTSWITLARVYFYVQVVSVAAIFGCIFWICSNHYLEYLYAYKHTSKELEFKYLLACIWEDQSGSFLLWSIWHCILGLILIRKTKEWEAPVMTVVSLAQTFLAMMIMGVYLGGIKIGNSPFVLTRNEIGLDQAPVFIDPVTNSLRADYLKLMKDGVGLNVLLRNYWMVIHPPVLFLGFASTIVPFAYAYAGMQTKKFGDWVKPALPHALFSACVLGVGIMMGGKWAYESLTFGGYWAWDPVENASLVPWLILVAGLHTMVIYKATDHSLRGSYLFIILSFLFVLYSTFLTRTGILGDTSVHAFTEAGKAMNILILSFLLFFTLGSFALYILNYKKIPAVVKEEQTNSREFWMFIGSLVLFLSALFVIGQTSVPVINAVFNTKLAPSEDAEFAYNKVMVLVAVITGVLTAITQYFKYKNTPGNEFAKKIAWPTLGAALVIALLAVFYPLVYSKKGPGFLVAIYAALFASIYAVLANAVYIKKGLNGNLKAAGGSIAHLGFGLMIAGMLISAGNKKVISQENYKAFAVPVGIDPMTKQQDVAAENLNLIRELPTRMGDYEVTYYGDSSGHETGRKFYHLRFQKKEAGSRSVSESFVLNPDVYLMKNNSMSSNPDTKRYLTHDVFTYISNVLNPANNVDTASFKYYEKKAGDTIFYSKGFMVYHGPNKNHHRIVPPGTQLSIAASITLYGKDSTQYHPEPVLMVEKEDPFLVKAGRDSIKLTPLDDTLYAENLYLRFASVNPENGTVRIGVKEPERMIDFITLKAYVFPWINLVWLGLVLMAIGFIMSMLNRMKVTGINAILIITVVFIALCYMFFIASN